MKKRLLVIFLPNRTKFREATLNGTLDPVKITEVFRQKGYESEICIVDPHEKNFNYDRYTKCAGQLMRLHEGYFTELVLLGSDVHMVTFDALDGLPDSVRVRSGASPGSALDLYLRMFARDKIGQARTA